MDLVRRVQAFAARHGLWSAGTPVIAAVSGGADSVALLFVLHELARVHGLRLARVAHLHHHIRGVEADEDAAFVERLAHRLGVPFELAHEDVPALAAARGASLELAGRHARLAFFARLAAAAGSPLIALAHTRTDQAETVLLRLTRGAGTRGLAGMAPRADHRVRPLLDEPRQALRDYLTARGETWREDPSNADTRIVRNLVRHDVLPVLARINPGVEAALARAARGLAEDADLLETLAAAEADRLLQGVGPAVSLSRSQLERLPPALARRVVRHALQRVSPGGAVTWEAVDAVVRATHNQHILGSVQLELNGDLAVLVSRDVASAGDAVPVDVPLVLTLDVPGTVRHPLGWWEVEAAGPMAPPAAPDTRSTGTRVVLDAAAIGRHLTIRGWRPGDRVQPLGLGGRKKLQDVFVDRKVPRDERPFVPVVAGADGRIAWVAGHVVDESFRVTPRSEAVVVLTLRR